MVQTLSHKKRINNIYFMTFFHRLLHKLNTEPTSPLFQTLDEAIEHLKTKHFNADRAWRYDWTSMRMRTWQELVDRREEANIDDFTIGRGGVDQTMVLRAVEAEKK